MLSEEDVIRLHGEGSYLGKGTYSEVVRSQLGNADVVVKKMQGSDANGISQTALREVCTAPPSNPLKNADTRGRSPFCPRSIGTIQI